MKRTVQKILSAGLVLVSLLALASAGYAAPAASLITTPATGYTSAADVQYVTAQVNGRTVVYNWGARGEDCLFLSTYALDFYEESYETLASYAGSKYQNQVPETDLYNHLAQLMTQAHSYYTYYDGSKNVRDFYKYTDCVSNDTSQVALLYRGGLVSSRWDSGKTWNQEHMFPKSRLSSAEQIGDIMHLRPANPTENSTRGNTAYGPSSSGFYDPGVSVRGDCARMVLYMYVRWGCTNAFGSNGCIQNMNVLLQWIQEDPVDTWEMARNDAVQSVTGTRNVFVDYPELAFVLFDKEIPSDMVTPSGQAVKQSGTEPTEPTQAPTEATPAPTEPTQAPTEPTPAPTESTQAPTEPTQAPTEPTQAPTEPTQTPTEATQAPTEPTPAPTAPSASAGCMHRMTLTPAVPHTCTESGTIAYYTCSECNKLFADEAGTQELTQAALTDPAAHDLQYRERVEATADTEGTIAHYRCQSCDKAFSDPEGTDRLLSNRLTIPKKDYTAIDPEQPEPEADPVTTIVLITVLVVAVAIAAVLVVLKVRKPEK